MKKKFKNYCKNNINQRKRVKKKPKNRKKLKIN